MEMRDENTQFNVNEALIHRNTEVINKEIVVEPVPNILESDQVKEKLRNI